MILSDFFKQNNLKLTPQLTSLIAKAYKHIFPNLVPGVGWNDDSITNYIINLDLSNNDIIQLVNYINRYGSVWSFS